MKISIQAPDRHLSLIVGALSLLLLCGGVAQAQSVQFMEKDGLHISRYMVKGAEGANQGAAVDIARASALRFAGEELAGDNHRVSAGAYLASRPAAAMGYANMKRITRITWGSKGPKLDVVVDVDTTQLRKLRVNIGAQVNVDQQQSQPISWRLTVQGPRGKLFERDDRTGALTMGARQAREEAMSNMIQKITRW